MSEGSRDQVAKATEFVWRTSRSLPDVRNWATTVFAAVMKKWGFEIDVLSENAMSLVRSRRFWPMAILSPIALLLSPYQKDQVVVTFASAGPGRSQMTVVGDVPNKIANILHGLPQDEPRVGIL